MAITKTKEQLLKKITNANTKNILQYINTYLNMYAKMRFLIDQNNCSMRNIILI